MRNVNLTRLKNLSKKIIKIDHEKKKKKNIVVMIIHHAILVKCFGKMRITSQK